MLDFTADQLSLDSVKVGDSWSTRVALEVDELNDFRELKGYGVFIQETTNDYHGSQNVNDGFEFSVSENNPIEVSLGSNAQTLFTFQVNSLYDININSLIFSHSGTGDKNNISNLKLYDIDNDEQILGSVASIGDDNKIEFLNLEIDCQSEIKRIKLVGDISSAVTQDETHQFSLESATIDHDVVITGLPISNTITIITNEEEEEEIIPGTLTLLRTSDCPSGNVAKNATNMVVAKYELKATGEAVKITSMDIRTYGTIGTDDLYQGKIYVNGSQKGTTATLVSTATNSGSGETVFTFGNNFIIAAGDTAILEVKADIKTGLGGAYSGSETFTIQISDAVAQGRVSMETVTIGTATGYTLTIAAGTITTALNQAQPDWSSLVPTGVQGSSNAVLVGAFVVSAGSSEGADISAIAMTYSTSSNTNLQNIQLYNGTKASGTLIGTVSTPTPTGNTAYSVYPSPYINLAKSGSFNLNVYAEILTGASTTTQGTMTLGVVSGTGKVTNTSVSSVGNVTGQAIYIAEAGSLTVALDDSGTPKAAQLVAGTTGVEFTKVKFTAGPGENMEVTQVVVNSTRGGNATVGAILNIVLYDSSDMSNPLGTKSSLVAAGTATFDLSSNPWVIPTGQTKKLIIKADVSTYEKIASSSTILLKLDSAAVTSRGADSGTAGGTSAAAAGLVMSLYKTTVTASERSDTPSGKQFASDAEDVMYFNLTNNSAYYSAYFNYATFTISYTVGTGNTTTSATRRFDLYEIDSNGNLDTTSLGNVTLSASTTIDAATVAIDVTTDFEIGAGETKGFALVGDIRDAGEPTASSGSTIRFYIADGTDLNWDDEVSTAVQSTGSKNFRLNGGVITF